MTNFAAIRIGEIVVYWYNREVTTSESAKCNMHAGINQALTNTYNQTILYTSWSKLSTLNNEKVY